MSTFSEICISEVQPDRVDEFEKLKVAVYHKSYVDVTDVKYIKRTHSQKDFNSVKMENLQSD